MKIGKDKYIHACVCACISLASTECAVGAALGKEYGDSKAKGNHWCWWDCLADLVGIAVGTAIRLLICGKWNWL